MPFGNVVAMFVEFLKILRAGSPLKFRGWYVFVVVGQRMDEMRFTFVCEKFLHSLVCAEEKKLTKGSTSCCRRRRCGGNLVHLPVVHFVASEKKVLNPLSWIAKRNTTYPY